MATFGLVMPFLHKVSQNIIKCIYGHQIGPGNIVPHLLLECNVWVEWNQTLGWGGKGFQLHDGHYSSFILFFVIDNNGILCQNLDWTRYWTTEQIYLSWVCHNYVSLHWYMIFSVTLLLRTKMTHCKRFLSSRFEICDFTMHKVTCSLHPI